MSDDTVTQPVDTDTNVKALIDACNVCGRTNSRRLMAQQLAPQLLELIKANVSASEDIASVCEACTDLFRRAQEQVRTSEKIFGEADHALPTPLRMDADDRYTGRGVTIAFLDSGFYAHKD